MGGGLEGGSVAEMSDKGTLIRKAGGSFKSREDSEEHCSHYLIPPALFKGLYLRIPS